MIGDSAASIATLEAERTLLDRVPELEAEALDLETLRMMDPALGKNATQAEMSHLLQTGSVGRLGSGKRGDPYRYFTTIKKVFSTQTSRSKQQTEIFQPEDADDFRV